MTDSARQLSELSAAFSETNKSSNKRWVFAASLSLLSLSLVNVQEYYIFFGTEFDREFFVMILAIALPLANVVFVTAQMSSVRVATMFEEKLNALGYNEKNFTQNFSMKDFYYAGVHSSYSRLSPLFSLIGSRLLGKHFYRFFKIFADFVFVMLPCMGILHVLSLVSVASFATVSLWVFGILSVMLSLILWLYTLKYIFR